MGGTTSRELFALTNDISIVVISIRLITISEVGQVAPMVRDYLSTHLIGNVYLVDLPFELGTPTGANDYDFKMRALVERLSEGDLSRYPL